MSSTLHERPTAAGSGSAGEFAALVSGAGVFDLAGRARIALTGGDRVRWLNGMVSNNVRDLEAGHGVYAFLLNPQGHILADLYAYNHGESFVVDVESSLLAKVLDHFDHYIIMDDVEVTDLTDKTAAVAVAGPKAHEVLTKAGLAVPDLEPLQFTETTWQGTPLTVARRDNPAVSWFDLWLAPGDVPKLRESLVAAGAEAVGAPTLELLRVACGVPRYGQDIRERDLPQETEQQRALNFSKGCYIGQEIVERIRSRGSVHRKFTGFLIDGPALQPGTKIQVEGKNAGEITSVVSLPLPGGERNLALGYIRREIGVPGKQVQAGEALATVAELPFAGVF
jgi:folate-binding protein YgfZ